MAVAKAWRRKGIASELLTAVEDMCLLAGAPEHHSSWSRHSIVLAGLLRPLDITPSRHAALHIPQKRAITCGLLYMTAHHQCGTFGALKHVCRAIPHLPPRTAVSRR